MMHAQSTVLSHPDEEPCANPNPEMRCKMQSQSVRIRKPEAMQYANPVLPITKTKPTLKTEAIE